MLQALLTAVLLTGSALPAGAASLGIAPTRVVLGLTDRSSAVTLENQADQPVTVQVQTFAWPRSPASDQLEPTRDLLAVPPVVSLEPGARQIIRVALRAPRQGSVERAYRLLITEVPPAPREDSVEVRFALRLSLPVFVAAEGARAEPSWTARREGSRALLELSNRGSAHIRVRRIELHAAGDERPAQVIDASAYVLPGQTQSWPLAAAASAQRELKLQADTDLGPLEAELVLPPG
jgi:fimbrial chaperone protein